MKAAPQKPERRGVRLVDIRADGYAPWKRTVSSQGWRRILVLMLVRRNKDGQVIEIKPTPASMDKGDVMCATPGGIPFCMKERDLFARYEPEWL